MKKKVLYIGGTAADEKGAIGTHTSGIINSLEKNNSIELFGVFLSDSKPSFLPKESYFHKIKSIKKNYFSKVKSTIKYSKYIRDIVKATDPDYIYIRYSPFSYLSFYIFNLDFSRKVILEYNDIFYEQILFAAKRGEWSSIDKWIRLSKLYKIFVLSVEKLAFRKSYLTVLVTEGLLDYCINIESKANAIVVQNATNIFKVQDSENVGNSCLYLAHIGTLTYWDGLEELVDALHIALNINKSFNFNFNIIGDGALKEKLVNKVKALGMNDFINFIEPMPHDKAIKFLEKTDVVPLLKTIDGYGLSPIKFYEAMGSGCYLLSSDIPHINEVPDFVGKVVSFPLEVNEIASDILDIWENIENIRSNKSRIASFAIKNCSWDARVDQIVQELK